MLARDLRLLVMTACLLFEIASATSCKTTACPDPQLRVEAAEYGVMDLEACYTGGCVRAAQLGQGEVADFELAPEGDSSLLVRYRRSPPVDGIPPEEHEVDVYFSPGLTGRVEVMLSKEGALLKSNTIGVCR